MLLFPAPSLDSENVDYIHLMVLKDQYCSASTINANEMLVILVTVKNTKVSSSEFENQNLIFEEIAHPKN